MDLFPDSLFSFCSNEADSILNSFAALATDWKWRKFHKSALCLGKLNVALLGQERRPVLM